jgi:hypothetical protein
MGEHAAGRIRDRERDLRPADVDPEQRGDAKTPSDPESSMRAVQDTTRRSTRGAAVPMKSAGGSAGWAIRLPVAVAEGKPMSWRALAASAGLVAGLGCAAFSDPMGRERALADAQLRYTQQVRWGNLDAASEFIAPEERAAFLGQTHAFEAIRITEYDIGRIDYGEDRRSATVHVTYHGYSLASAQEQRIDEQQTWTRPGSGNSWLVRPQLAGLIESFPAASR